MTMTDIVLPVVQGAFTVLIIALVLFGLYKFLRFLGIIKIFKKQVTPTQEEYIEVMGIVKEDKSLEHFAIWVSKFEKKKADRYLRAYIDITEQMKDIESKKEVE